MKYVQNTVYQNINGVGRDCTERWEFIKDRINIGKDTTSVDVGSAEGFYVKELAKETKGKVISIEGSGFVYNTQKEYIKEYNDQVELHNIKLNIKNIDMVGVNVDNTLLLSVLHWFDDPDSILKKLSSVSKNMFIELPDLNCKQSWNQEYLNRIKTEYGNIENYIQTMTNKEIIDFLEVKANHVGGSRFIYFIKNI